MSEEETTSRKSDFKTWTVEDASSPRDEELAEAAEMLRRGRVVAFSTETVYGLGAAAGDAGAIAGVFRAKGRPADNPLIVHVSSTAMAEGLCEGGELPPVARRLAARFWPGPLTLIVRLRDGAVSPACSAGLSTVGVRMPDHAVALALIRLAGVPVAAPSANVSGRPSPTEAAHVAEDFGRRPGGEVAGVVDGGAPRVGVESTIVDCTLGEGRVCVLRPGGVTAEQLREVVREVEVDAGLTDPEAAPRAPGTKYRHYAPRAPLYLVEEGSGADFFRECVAARSEGGRLRVGVVTTEEARGVPGAAREVVCGRAGDPGSVARLLYAALREFDLHGDVDVIVAPSFARRGLGAALMNRLDKASGGRVLRRGGGSS